jgi:U3 small nucleolar RNA-associated protein 18
VEFHPARAVAPLLFTAGLDKRLRFFEVDGTTNRHVHTAVLEDLPLRDAHFVDGGNSVLAVGRRSFFYVYDVRAARCTKVPRVGGRTERSWESVAVAPSGSEYAFLGDEGVIALVSSSSHLLTGTLAIDGPVRTAAFEASGHRLWASGTTGIVHCFDLRMRKLLHRFADHGSSPSTAIHVSPDANYLAVGSDAGIANLYHIPTLESSLSSSSTSSSSSSSSFFRAAVPTVEPARGVDNLTTTIHGLAFNHSAEMLALWSHSKRDQLRLLHVPSRTVFQDWPTGQTPLKHVNSLAFSPDSAYVAIGNDRGRVLLYHIPHYRS